MLGTSMVVSPALIGVYFVLGLFAVAFGQSGIDKITDAKGNREWLDSHFAKSPFKGMVGLLLPAITLLELASAVLCAIGIVTLAVSRNASMAIWGLALVGLTLLCLFAGQRLAKDYAGAMTLAVYGGVLVLGCLALHALIG